MPNELRCHAKTSGEYLIHSGTLFDGEGNSEFELRLISIAEFEIERKDWYDSDAGPKELT